MVPLWQVLADRWVARYATPAPGALDGVAGLIPAVVVTGGSSGIGFAIARAFARTGRYVVLIGRDEARLKAAHASLPPSEAAHSAILALDVTDPGAAVAIEAALTQHGLYLDVLVNSAGIGLSGPFDSHENGDIAHLIALNITALTALTRHALPAMRARARGGVINVSSLGGYVPGPHQAAYYASKAYVCSLTEALHAECAGSGVRIIVVAPGPVDTRFHAAMGADGSFYRWLLPAVSPERVARAALTGFQLNRRVVVPGVMPKLLTVAVTVLPHAITLPMVRWLLAPRP